MLIVKDFLSGNNPGLKEIVRARTEQNNPDIIAELGLLTAYPLLVPTPAMIVMRTCSLMVNGPGLSGMPKSEIFGRYRAQALQIGRVNSMETYLSHRIRFSN